MEVEIEKFLLYARAALWLIASAQVLFVLIQNPRMRAIHILIIAIFAILGIGGLSALAGYAAFGQTLVAYVVTGLLVILNICMSVYLIRRKPER